MFGDWGRQPGRQALTALFSGAFFWLPWRHYRRSRERLELLWQAVHLQRQLSSQFRRAGSGFVDGAGLEGGPALGLSFVKGRGRRWVVYRFSKGVLQLHCSKGRSEQHWESLLDPRKFRMLYWRLVPVNLEPDWGRVAVGVEFSLQHLKLPSLRPVTLRWLAPLAPGVRLDWSGLPEAM